MMKRCAEALVCNVAVLLLIAGCAVERESPIAQGPLTAQENQWLAKAYRQDSSGWIYLHIEGAPFERGFQRGYLTADETADFLKTLAYTQKFETAKDLDFFVAQSAKLFKGKVSAEYVEEMKGMVAGMRRRGKEVTYDEMLFMNGYIDVCWYWWPKEKESMGPGCSAFIATGEATADGKIVMAHNSWDDYSTGVYGNIIVDLVPDEGHRILMQSWGPLIYSGADFFITSAGLIGTETTIGGFKGFDPAGTPVFERARKAMQYANTIDEWAQIMVEHNSGAYANSWLLGNIRTNEIARLELGLKHHSLEKKQSGYFSGSNVTDDIALLRDEADLAYTDIRTSPVARRERWKQLMRTYNGKVDVELAKKMLADHYDVYEGQEKPGLRTICGHGELDDGRIPGGGSGGAYSPSGALDGKVVDSKMAANWQFWAKWGSSCDRNFIAKEFLEKHTQYDWLKGYLKDLPAEPWTIFPREKEPSTAAIRP
jgi:hypothetical protein